MRTILILLSLPLLAALAAAGCGDAGGSASEPELVASTPIVADLAANVAGETTTVKGLLPLNADPHAFEPSPSDAEALTGARLVIRSGGDLDPWLDELLDGSGSSAPILDLNDSVRATAAEHGHEDEREAAGDDGHEHDHGDTDPHWWQDPANAITAVEAIRDALAEADPAGATGFARNAAGYIARLEELDAAIEACVSQIPRSDRELVTSHDAFGYYADRYGFELIGAAIPALSTAAQASAGATAELVDLIAEHDVKAVFPEAGTSAGLESAIAGEAGVRIGPELRADSLGPEGSGAETYIGAMAANTLAIAGALSGDAAGCGKLKAIAADA